MKRTIITFGGYFEEFIKALGVKEVKKIDYLLSLLETERILSKEIVKFIEDEIYELRMLYAGNIYRVFFIFDDGNIVVLFNGFHKKTQKTPKGIIEKAKRIKMEYYEFKKRNK